MIPCILMLISVGVGLVILVLFITSFLLTIFAWIIFGAKGVLWISVVSLLVLRMIFNCKREIDAAKEEEEHRRRAAAAEEARKERERQVEREKELRRLQEPFRQAELRQRQYMAENSLGEQQPPERTGPTSSMNTSRPPQRMGCSPLGGDCVICCVRAADTLVMPCKHLALCGACSSKMRTGSSGPEGRCPLCRAHIVDKMKIFRS
ncbi:uncharacterized protein LAJ45_10926 [Morchella importuna]|uniref:uncharacterized protein n=1 Tax=Morchella importuna TaxID=1174673 RepID=UPI001E8EC0E5|nr:uncharacterized protein LAJ45_10926 [Morchella importuna]KAH8145016.1 hypothetical protein LAJ45_10926 [Morchella importuna]